MNELANLRRGLDEDDYGRLRPTQHAFDRSVDLLVDANRQCPIPAGCVSTDSEGGVRIEWIRPTASVHLVVPAKENRVPYVYHEVDAEYATEDATPELLADRIRKLS